MYPLKPSVPILGPYTVGSTEFEIPISDIDTATGSAPIPAISTVKFRLFYPTDVPSKGQTVPWVPAPQKQWTEAFGRFLGASLGWSSIVNPLLSLMTYITIPAVPNASLRPNSSPYPLLVFSHGLAGNCNTYSSLCGSLASCGMIVAASEHRDGSCPISMLRDASGNVVSEINYTKYAHTPTPDVFNARNRQLRTRLWELDLIYKALDKLNAGKALSNYALAGSEAQAPTLTSKIDLAPGRVTWAGHSFGACTMTQFVKSIYYRASLPSLKGTSHEHDPNYEPLYVPRSGSGLTDQITPSSPVALLDVWTMPFRAPSAQWLWEKPMPCYDTTASHTQTRTRPTTVSIMSTEFYNWTELLNRTLALLSANPAKAAEEQHGTARSPQTPKLEDMPPRTPTFATPPNKHPLNDDDDDDETAEYDNDLLPPASLPLDDATSTLSPPEPIDRSMTTTPLSTTSSASASSSNTTSSNPQSSVSTSPGSSTTSLSPSLPAKAAGTTPTIIRPAALFHVPHTAHLSQSDFGPLFPTLTRLLMKAVEPQRTIELNVRAITQAMRNAGVGGGGGGGGGGHVRRVDEPLPPPPQRASWFRGWFGGGSTATDAVQGDDDDSTSTVTRHDAILESGAPTTTGGAAAEEKQRQQKQKQQRPHLTRTWSRQKQPREKDAAAAGEQLHRWVELAIPDVVAR